MATEVTNSQEPGTATLVRDIINDAQELLKQQIHLFRVEMRQDIDKVKKGIPAAALALCLVLSGILLLGFAVSHLLFWAFPAVPLWVWYAVVAVLWVGFGALIILLVVKAKALVPVPEQTVEALKENVEWKTNRS